MHSRILGLLAVLTAGGWALAQAPAPVIHPAPTAGAVAPHRALAGTVTYPAGLSATPVPNGQPAVPSDAACGAGGAGAGGPLWYASADYLLWQIRKGNIPMAASTVPVGLIALNISDLFSFSPSGSPNFEGARVTGYSPISILNEATFGGGPFTNIGGQNGTRATVGFWADTDMSWGVEASGFFLERASDEFVATSSQQGNQFLLSTAFSRSLFLIGADGTQSLLRTFDVFVAREASSSLIGSASSTLYGAEVNGRCCCCRVGGFDYIGLVGFRYLNFNDWLSILNNVRLFAPPGIPPTDADATGSLSRDLTFRTVDNTRIYNHFFGVQVGGELDAKFGACFINTRLKAAVGNMHQVADVQSFTTLINNDPGRSPAPYTTPGGLMAAPGDNGRRTRDRFGFIPEVNVKLGYQLTEWLRGYVGYDGLLMVNAARPGGSVVLNTLDTTVRVAQTPDVNVNIIQPTFKFRDQDVWVQGISVGLEARY